jgi:SAM-dependent methyltransferase
MMAEPTLVAANDEANSYAYCGSELELFAKAVRWKGYLHRQIAPFLGARVLEVGAGIGTTARALCRQPHDRWLLLEPDSSLAEKAAWLCRNGDLPACCTVQVGTTDSLTGTEQFDTVLYIDVLEHIDNDLAEFRRAASLLSPGGNLVVLCPAHQFLFSEFDEHVGHCRRHTRQSYSRLTAEGLRGIRVRYLDSVGMLALLANRTILRQSVPSARQIAFWDNVLVPCSRLVDPVTGYRLGKSILGVWRRAA